jgi:hypothetical protein
MHPPIYSENAISTELARQAIIIVEEVVFEKYLQ